VSAAPASGVGQSAAGARAGTGAGAAPALSARARTPLREFDLDIELTATAGGPLALVGRSGAGKTSMLRVIAGLLSPRAGRVDLDGTPWLDTERGIDLPAERRRCGFLFQDYALFPRMSAWRNVAYGMSEPRGERREAALAMLERFGVGALADARPPALSGGERQRVALARALAARPRALLLDEPLSALDSTTRREALRELRGVLAELAAPVVLVTHSFDEAAILASDLAVVDRGVVVQRGSAAAISAAPASPFVADFAGAVVLRGEASGAAGGLTLVRLAGGGEVRSVDAARGPVAVSVFPWDISLESPDGGESRGAVTEDTGIVSTLRDRVRQAGISGRCRTVIPLLPDPGGSMLNRVAGEVTAVTTIGNRARVGVATPQAVTAEITAASAERLGLRPGTRVVAAWKASSTRLVPDA
jgi:molybdate transport system ATP-binding protein